MPKVSGRTNVPNKGMEAEVGGSVVAVVTQVPLTPLLPSPPFPTLPIYWMSKARTKERATRSTAGWRLSLVAALKLLLHRSPSQQYTPLFEHPSPVHPQSMLYTPLCGFDIYNCTGKWDVSLVSSVGLISAIHTD